MRTGLRIALLTHSTNPRGGVVHALELADALHALGHEVTLFAPDPQQRGLFRPPRCRYVGVPARAPQDEGSGLAGLVAQRIAEYVAWFSRPDTPSFDVYHAQDSISANALAELKAAGIIPGFVRTVHHLDDFEDARLAAWQRRGYRDADQVLCVSRLWRDTLEQAHGIAATLVSNGVDLERYTGCAQPQDAALRRRLGLDEGPVFLAVGGVEPRKNTIRILDAFVRVRRAMPQAQLVIAGGLSLLDHSAYVSEFDARVKASRLATGPGQALQLLGRVADEDMPCLFRLADALVFPSLREGFGLVVLEALACGTPVVAPRLAPFTEYLTAGACAWADPESPASIAAAMAYACNPAAARTLVEAGQAICARYSWHDTALRHADIYHSHLTRTGACHA